MYRFMLRECQAKNEWKVEKMATIFQGRITRGSRNSNEVVCLEKSKCQSREEVMPTMSDDARAETAPKDCEKTEESTEYREQNHVASALISMSCTEE